MADDAPTIVFGSKIEYVDNDEVHPFYLSLNVHDMIVYNSMIDSSASHNLMPKGVVEILRLEVTRPYKDLYSFDSRKVKCLGLIQDMVATLEKMPYKTVVMDVVVANILLKFGVLLSRSWTYELKGSLQMDMSYATIPMYGGNKRLYSEKRSPHVIRSQEKIDNHAIYDVDTDLGSSIFFNDVSPCDLEISVPIEEKEEAESAKK